MKYTLYQTKNLVNNKIYIGVHKTTNPNDNYLGSGKELKKAIKKYGKGNFKKVILFEFDDPKLAYEKESQIVDKSFVLREDTYNIAVGGRGDHPMGHVCSEHTKKIISESQKDIKNNFYGRRHSDTIKKIMSQKKIGKNNHMSKSIKIDNIIYDSISIASKSVGIPHSSLVKKHRKLNKTNYNIEELLVPLSKM